MAISMEPFNRLVKLVARAFYDDITLKGENQPKNGRSDNRGMAVVVLDALTRRQWVREEDLAKALKLHSKQLRRTLRFFEEEKLVARDHRRETAKGAKMFSAAVAATADGSQTVKDGEEKMKIHTHSYCCLDYTQIYDVVRYRMHRMKKKLKDELENRNTIQEYTCPTCKRRYSALDAAQLISPSGDCFRCEKCNTELVAESDKLAAEEVGEGDDNARRRHREKLKIMLQKIEEQLKPLTQQLARVRDLPLPEFGSLQAWEARNSVGQIPNGDSGANDSSRNSQGQGYGGTSMPFLGETRVEVDLSGAEIKGDNNGAETTTTSLKVLPPWMIKDGMNLTKEQRGVVKSDSKIGSSSTTSDEKKPKDEKEDDKRIQDEYIKAYYAAYFKRQQEQEEAARKMQQETSLSNGILEKSSERQVGMKAKRDDDDDDDDDTVKWEDASTAATAANYSASRPRCNTLSHPESGGSGNLDCHGLLSSTFSASSSVEGSDEPLRSSTSIQPASSIQTATATILSIVNRFDSTFSIADCSGGVLGFSAACGGGDFGGLLGSCNACDGDRAAESGFSGGFGQLRTTWWWW